MTIYLIHLLIVMIFAALAQRTTGRFVAFISWGLLWGVMVSVPAARSVFVGTDSFNYVSISERYDTLSVVFEEQSEAAFGVLCYVAHALSDNYFVFFLLISGTISICYIFGIKKCSHLPLLAVFILMTYFFYGHMNTARQSLATAFLFLAICCIFERKIWPYLVLCLVATLFHRTAIIFFPLYFIVRQKLSWKQLLIFTLISSVIAVYYASIIETVGEVYEKYAGYAEGVEEGRGLVTYSVVLLHCIFFSFFRNRIEEHQDQYDIMLSLYIIGTLISTIGVFNNAWASGFARLAIYFTQSMILMWPIVIINLKDRTTRLSLLTALGVLYTLYFIVTTMTFASLVPYNFNPMVLEWLGY